MVFVAFTVLGEMKSAWGVESSNVLYYTLMSILIEQFLVKVLF
jgi:hypothetical protein